MHQVRICIGLFLLIWPSLFANESDNTNSNNNDAGSTYILITQQGKKLQRNTIKKQALTYAPGLARMFTADTQAAAPTKASFTQFSEPAVKQVIEYLTALADSVETTDTDKIFLMSNRALKNLNDPNLIRDIFKVASFCKAPLILDGIADLLAQKIKIDGTLAQEYTTDKSIWPTLAHHISSIYVRRFNESPPMAVLDLYTLVANNNKKFLIHKEELAHAPMLKSMFAGSMREAAQREGHLSNFSEEVVQKIIECLTVLANNHTKLNVEKVQLMRSLLTASIEQPDMLQDIFEAASYLMASHICTAAASLLAEQVDPTTIDDVQIPSELAYHAANYYTCNLHKRAPTWLIKQGFTTEELYKENKIPLIQHFEAIKGSFLGLDDLNITSLKGIEKIPGIESLDHLSMNLSHLTSLQEFPFDALPSLKQLYITHSTVHTLFNKNSKGSKTLLLLNLNNNNITHISADSFTGLDALVALDLSGNPIVSIDENAFSHLNRLETLILPVSCISNLYKTTRYIPALFQKQKSEEEKKALALEEIRRHVPAQCNVIFK